MMPPTGQPISKKPNGCLVGCGIVIAIFFVLVVLGAIINAISPSRTSAPETSTQRDNSSQEQSSSESHPAVTHEHGFTILGGLGYRIDSLSHPDVIDSFGEEKSPAGEFIVLHISVENVGSKAADISASDFHLESRGAEFDEDTNVTVDGEFFLEKLNPGTAKSGVVVFDVPANTSPHKYTLKVFGNGTEGSQDSTLIQL